MEYTVDKLGKLAGVSTRTLRYYDQIEILKPARINSSGYRIYGAKEVDRLQQILFYRELGVGLEKIKEILCDASFDEREALEDHLHNLLDKREQLDVLIATLNKTIETMKGSVKMSDREKFEGFKAKMIEDNERKYGKEVREKYGEEAVQRSNDQVQNMTEEQYKQVTALESKMLQTLAQAIDEGNPAGELAQKAADLHKQWLTFYWGQYSKEAHAGLGTMYVEDERFKAYYDKQRPGTAEFLRDAILEYTR